MGRNMAKAGFSVAALKPEYEELYKSCNFVAAKVPEISAGAAKIKNGQQRYEQLMTTTGVPWYVIGVLHYRESTCNFNTHLYNGDPLTARTVQYPPGRPTDGTPPFAFEFSAEHALKDDGFSGWTDWSLAGTLFRCESFNGFGFRAHNVHTPYLWGFSQHYTSGGFPHDHEWLDTYVNKQCGCATLLKWMEVHGIIAPLT